MKNKKSIFISIYLTLLTVSSYAQRFADQVPQIRRYYQKDVVDSIEGIKVYNRLLEAIGGDSITYNKAGYNLQGWNEDFYMSGKILHRGYYIDGKVIVFKNFFENGQVERTVVNPDPLHCNIEIFFENGKPRRKINYYNGLPTKRYEFFASGLPKYTEENEKEMKYCLLKKSWYANGGQESLFEITDEKNKKFSIKNYYQNGQLKEEGQLGLSEDGKTYLKEGTWISYDQNGKNKKIEKFKEAKVFSLVGVR